MSSGDNDFRFGRFRLSTTLHCLYRDSEIVPLTPTEYNLLSVLLSRRGKPVEKDELMRLVWGDTFVDENNLAQHVRALRKKLGDDEEGHPYIQTLPRIGYCFREASIRDQEQAAQQSATAASGIFPQPDIERIPILPVPPTTASMGNGRKRQSRTRAVILLLMAGLVLSIGGAYYFYAPRNTTKEPPSSAVLTVTVGQGPRVVRMIPVRVNDNTPLLTPDGRDLYIANSRNNSITVLNTISDKISDVVAVGARPWSLAVLPDGSKVYVGQQGGNLSVIETADKHVTSIDTGDGPVEDIAITPDGRKLYLAMGYSGIRALDIRNNSISQVSRLVYARAFAISPNGQRLYVSYQAGGPNGSMGHDSIGYFDTDTDRFIGSIHGFPNVGECLTFSPDGSQVWECGGDACRLQSYDHAGCAFVPAALVNVINTASSKLLRSVIFRGTVTNCVTVLPNGTAAVSTTQSILLIDSKQFRVVGSIPVRSTGKFAITKDGSLAYVPIPDEGRIAVVELARQVHAVPVSNRASRGSLPVAILAASDFDPNSIDPTTVALAGTGVRRTPAGLPIASCEKIPGLDGLALILDFPAGTLALGESAQLDGQTFSGVTIRARVQFEK